jgi:hypothetical protein
MSDGLSTRCECGAVTPQYPHNSGCKVAEVARLTAELAARTEERDALDNEGVHLIAARRKVANAFDQLLILLGIPTDYMEYRDACKKVEGAIAAVKARAKAEGMRQVADAIEADHTPGTYPYSMAKHIREMAAQAEAPNPHSAADTTSERSARP